LYLKLEGSFVSDADRNCEAVYENGTDIYALDSLWPSSNHWGKKGNF
jgi:hypothetical protein